VKHPLALGPLPMKRLRPEFVAIGVSPPPAARFWIVAGAMPIGTGVPTEWPASPVRAAADLWARRISG